jgi:predicted transcriptional regulator
MARSCGVSQAFPPTRRTKRVSTNWLRRRQGLLLDAAGWRLVFEWRFRLTASDLLTEEELSSDDRKNELARLTADIVSAYVAKNVTPQTAIAGVISDVHAALSGLGSASAVTATPAAVEEVQKPAVSIRKSISPDAVVCLECGKAFKSLKRHLQSHHGLAPEDYRAKWKLSMDYPMVAPNYAEARSSLAKQMGLGQRGPRKAKNAAKAKK